VPIYNIVIPYLWGFLAFYVRSREKYLNENKNIYLIGINFDEKERNISKFEFEKI